MDKSHYWELSNLLEMYSIQKLSRNITTERETPEASHKHLFSSLPVLQWSPRLSQGKAVGQAHSQFIHYTCTVFSSLPLTVTQYFFIYMLIKVTQVKHFQNAFSECVFWTHFILVLSNVLRIIVRGMEKKSIGAQSENKNLFWHFNV